MQLRSKTLTSVAMRPLKALLRNNAPHSTGVRSTNMKTGIAKITIAMILVFTMSKGMAFECEKIRTFFETYNANPTLQAMNHYADGKISFYIKRDIAFPNTVFGLSASAECIVNNYGEKMESPFDPVNSFIYTDAIFCEKQSELWGISSSYFKAYNLQMAAKLKIYGKECF